MSEEVKTQETEKGTKSKTPAVNPNISRMMEEREELSRDAVMSAIEDNDWLKIPDSLIREFYDEDGSLSGCILRGDVALAKQRIEYHEAKKELKLKRTKQMEEAIRNRLHSDHPDRRMPITDSSKEQVSKGRSPKFDA